VDELEPEVDEVVVIGVVEVRDVGLVGVCEFAVNVVGLFLLFASDIFV